MLRLKTLLLTSLALGCAAAAAATGTGLLTLSPFGLGQEMEQEKPTKMHELMMESVGEWSGVVKMTMPGMEGQEMKASESISAIGPFWTTSDFRGEFDGHPFQGRALMGYDAKAKKMVGTWCESSSSHLSLMEGEMDEETGTVTMHWMQPVMGAGKPVRHESVTTIEDDKYVSMFTAEMGGKKMPIMEIHMNREE